MECQLADSERALRGVTFPGHIEAWGLLGMTQSTHPTKRKPEKPGL